MSWYTEPSVWVSFASLAVATFSFINARISTKIARRSFALSKEQDERRRPDIRAYLIEAWRTRGPQELIVHVNLTFTNSADSGNSIVRVDLGLNLRLIGRLEPASVIEFRLPAQRNLPLPKFLSGDHLPLPVKLDAREAKGGWLSFAIPHQLLEQREIEKLWVAAEDSYGEQSAIPQIIAREYSLERQE